MILHYIFRKCIPYRNQNKQWPQIVAAIYCSLAMFSTGSLIAWTSPFIPKLISNDSDIGPMTMNEASYLAVLPNITMAALSLFMAMFMDYAGRQKALLLGTIAHCTSWIVLLFAKDVWVLYLSRLIYGIGDSVHFSALPIYLAEMAEPKVRGYYGPFLTINLFLGQFLINLIGSYMDISTTAAIFLCIPLVQIFLLLNIPESPYFLCMKNKSLDAKIALQRLRWTENVQQELEQIEAAVQQKISESTSFKNLLLIKANRRAFFVCICLRAIPQFSGLTAFTIFSQYLFALSGTSWSATTSSAVFFGVFLLITTAFSFISGKYGRKPLMSISCLGCFFALTAASGFLYIHEQTNIDTSSFNWMPLVGMLIFIIFASVGITVVPNIMVAELFPTNIKGRALALLCMFYAIFAIISVKMFQMLTDGYSMYLPFSIFAFCCLIGALFSYYLLPETKGKSLSEILEELNGNKVKDCNDNKEDLKRIG